MRYKVAGLSAIIAGALVFLAIAQSTAHRLQEKADRAKAGVMSLAAQGRDPSAILAILQQVKPALDAHDPAKAEVLLDRALSLLSEAGKAPADESPLPVSDIPEQPSDLYAKPEQVTISGYDGSAMEPFISPDGHYLFFNNENDPKVDTNLHFAERTGPLTFRYRGELPGVNSKVLDAVASVDRAGHFYFTTVRDYDRTMNSVYTGDFNGTSVTNLRPIAGDITPASPGAINMDVSISPDGQTLYISRAVIFPGAPAPKKSELMIAHLTDGAFHLDTDGARILKNVNTGALQYAPSISADGLELYFTRASQRAPGRASPGSVRIMVATRATPESPFDEPRVLAKLDGFVEAPTVPLDGSEMFFHKRVGERFLIFRAGRVR